MDDSHSAFGFMATRFYWSYRWRLDSPFAGRSVGDFLDSTDIRSSDSDLMIL